MHSGKNDHYTVFLRSKKFAQQKISPTYTPWIPYKYLYALSTRSILVNSCAGGSVHGHIHMVRILLGLYVVAVVIALLLGHIHGTFA